MATSEESVVFLDLFLHLYKRNRDYERYDVKAMVLFDA